MSFSGPAGGGIKFARVTYTGDGNPNHLINVGFVPKYILVGTVGGGQAFHMYAFSSASRSVQLELAGENTSVGTLVGNAVDVGILHGLYGGTNGFGTNYAMYAYG